VFVGVVTDGQWRVFCEAFGLAALAADATLATQRQRVEARDRTLPVIVAAFRGFTRAELMARCEALGLPFAPISRPAEMFDDPHLNGSGGLIAVTLPDGRETRLPALPLSLDGERLGRRRDLPQTGEHGAEIARELGYSEAEIVAMQGAGTLV
jgi:crotonobetainyl-CoA:carnitine CoA-transferase CaiB-like acyl-CoA transferase